MEQKNKIDAVIDEVLESKRLRSGVSGLIKLIAIVIPIAIVGSLLLIMFAW